MTVNPSLRREVTNTTDRHSFCPLPVYLKFSEQGQFFGSGDNVRTCFGGSALWSRPRRDEVADVPWGELNHSNYQQFSGTLNLRRLKMNETELNELARELGEVDIMEADNQLIEYSEEV